MNSQSSVISHQFSVKKEDKRLTDRLSIVNYQLTVYCLLFIAYCSLFIAGCGHIPKTLSEVHLKAIEFNQKAESAFKKGDYNKALEFYKEALRVNRSIENINGIAINLINMAIVHHRLSDKENAHRCVDEIVLSSEFGVRSELLSEAAFIKARIYMDEENYSQALEWADKALSFCKDIRCNIEGRIYNLKGRLALSKGDLSSATTYVTKALELNEGYGDREEVANSLRILADIKLSKKEYKEARRLFEDALTIDKSLGLTKKISKDLIGIGNTFFEEGMFEEALRYFKRALLVSESAGDKEGIKDAVAMMNKCLQNLRKR